MDMVKFMADVVAALVVVARGFSCRALIAVYACRPLYFVVVGATSSRRLVSLDHSQLEPICTLNTLKKVIHNDDWRRFLYPSRRKRRMLPMKLRWDN